MAHFAILKVGNIVEKVVVVSNDIATSEQAGIEFLRNFDSSFPRFKSYQDFRENLL